MVSTIAAIVWRPRGALLLLAFTGACASATAPSQPPVPAPRPAEPVAAPPPSPPAAAAARPLEAPRDWHLLDESTDGFPGIGAGRALRELLSGREPARSVVVAVIDGGVDTAHVDLRANLWRNPAETPGNDRDDDGNGYVDDVYGWNFIGGEDGENVHHDTFEVTRLHAACTGAPAAGPEPLPEGMRPQCEAIAAEFTRRRAEASQILEQLQMIEGVLAEVMPMLRQAVGTDSLSVANVTALRPENAQVQRARSIYLQLVANGLPPEDVADVREAYESQVRYGLDPSFDPRPIVGDDRSDPRERIYGNPDVTGPDAGHGTHVAGIIGAVRDNGIGVDGIAPAVQIMALRAVPDGDERDKDVANAIRYAADHGAHIINMSFGKAFSPGKSVVDEAVRYAESKGVLLVHAAGNDAKDLASEANYPSPFYGSGGRAENWIEVGASSWHPSDSLAAPFTNYGAGHVDVFAPGVDILSTAPGGGYERESGTSMAAPVVSGAAALLMAYFPNLTAADVKRILITSATRRGELMVVRPGSQTGETVRFGTLSATGGIVNLYEAVRLASRQPAS